MIFDINKSSREHIREAFEIKGELNEEVDRRQEIMFYSKINFNKLPQILLT
jgi:hypothetical protein